MVTGYNLLTVLGGYLMMNAVPEQFISSLVCLCTIEQSSCPRVNVLNRFDCGCEKQTVNKCENKHAGFNYRTAQYKACDCSHEDNSVDEMISLWLSEVN